MSDTEVISASDKGLPARAIGMTPAEFLATSPQLEEFWTPLIVLDDAAVQHNIDTMAAWCRAHGLTLMPHGKTTMAPALWRRQRDAGAHGITLATMGQVRTARRFGITSIMLAGSAVDARALHYLAAELADPALQFSCWVDSAETVGAMTDALTQARAPRPVDVLVELGAPGGRTGARSIAAAIAVAERVAASPHLRLAGVAGYEGALAHDRTPASLSAVRDYLRRLVDLHVRIRHLYGPGETHITAGGSAYCDLVAEVFRDAGAGTSDATTGASDSTTTHFTVRAGAYLIHDDGFYRGISPFDEGRTAATGPRLLPAMRGIARVVSQPEASLALLDAGKRDVPYDEGLPIPRAIAPDLGRRWTPLTDAAVTAVNDQHAFLHSTGDAPPVGSVVALGLSHPCTAFDKWRLLPVVDTWDSGRVIDLVRTYF